MDIGELKSSLQACQEILDELPLTIHNSIVETEENLKFLGNKLEDEKVKVEEQILNFQEAKQDAANEKSELKKHLMEMERLKSQKEVEKYTREALKERDGNIADEEYELEEELKYHEKMMSYLKSKINLYRMFAKIEWNAADTQNISGNYIKGDEEVPFKIQNSSAYDSVNRMWKIID
ncbi:unnamed protein product [Blepharisma stoltei]|uniref:Kinetochore protein Spc24 n=1 Tax=Blepharisma stoltei TaxID=1481888 RepID=A0AAU9JNI5_9CILI|nr:unnamed protein product [Blepharisma stoltei]